MNRFVYSLLAVAGVSGLALFVWSMLGTPASAHSNQHSRKHRLIAFKTMYGVDGPFVDSDFIRGVVGDELPWEIEEASGKVDSNGHVEVEVEGLVFKDDPSVPPELRGINDEESFRALVSCLTEADDQVEVDNVVTEPFPANVEGDSTIDTTVTLPNPCVAPIVFVLSGSEDKWFSVTGFEAEEEE
jgi:hypothetical protein